VSDRNLQGFAHVTLSWIQTQQIMDLAHVEELRVELDAGEAEAITLAIELDADLVLIDDHRGRIAASRLGLEITGILGIILVAKHRELIPAIKPIVDALIKQANFYMGSQLYAEILQSADE
jgi:predicted nucleic acid-binding protein